MPYKMNKPVAIVRESRSAGQSYTLAKLWELMKSYVEELEKKSGQYDTMMRLDLSQFHEWLRRREK